MSEDSMKTSGHEIPLFKMIQSLRAGLQESIKEADNHDLRFEVGNIELELKVTVEAKDKKEIKFWVIGAGGEFNTQDVHTFKLTLKPIFPDTTNEKGEATQRPVHISDERANRPKPPPQPK